MNKAIQSIGKLIIFIAMLFVLAHTFIVISDGVTSRDFLGLVIPNPPAWTSFIPYLGGFLGFIFNYFSLHGLVGVVISFVLIAIGISLNNLKK